MIFWIPLLVVIGSFIWVGHATLERNRALLRVRVLTVYFDFGPVEQTYFVDPRRAKKRFESLTPGDHGGDGRRIVRVELFQPFSPRN